MQLKTCEACNEHSSCVAVVECGTHCLCVCQSLVQTMSLPRPTLVGMLAIALSFCRGVSPFHVSPPQTQPFRGTTTTCSIAAVAVSRLVSPYTLSGANRHRPQPRRKRSQHFMATASSPLDGRNGTPGGCKRQRRLEHVRRDAGAADSWVGEAPAGGPDTTATAAAAGADTPSGESEAPPLATEAFTAAAPALTTEASAVPATTTAVDDALEGANFAPAGGPTFRELFTGRLPDWLLSRLEQLGFSSPTLVQRQALDVIMGEARSDAVLHAQTGSGKTLAFLLPFFSLVEPSRAAVQCLVVVPTRELGLQVAGVAKRLAAATGKATGGKVQVMSVLEGSSNKRQRAWAWADPPHIVIGNPENLSKLVATGAIRVNAVSYVVVDEVDACLLSEATRSWLHELLARSLSPTHSDDDEGEDEEEAARLVAAGAGRVSGAAAPVMRRVKDRQTVFASATVPQHNHFIRQCVQKQWTLTEPVHVQVHAKEAMPPCLSHFYVVCPPEQKLPVLRALIKRELGSVAGAKPSGGDPMADPKGDTRGLVFALPTKSLEDIASSLDKALGGGARGGGEDEPEPPPAAEFLREELGLNARADAMSLFREGKTRLLISTDMAARGLDVPEITHVFNLDLPADGEGYVHRGGRAGRLGRSGKIISIVTPAQEFVIRRLGNGIGIDIKRISLGSKRRKPAPGQ